MSIPVIEQFAELLAHGLTVAQASRQLGISPNYGNTLLQRIRKRLGPQAV